MTSNRLMLAACALAAVLMTGAASAQSVEPRENPDPVKPRDEGEGPYERLILRGVYFIDGTGAPTQGPADIVIENDRIADIRIVGAPKLKIDPKRRPKLNGGKELDLSGMYVLPGFVDTHMHLHSMEAGQKVPPEYILKLWLAHGVTSGRTVSSGNARWMIETGKRSKRNEVTAPRLDVYPAFNSRSLGRKPARTPEAARKQIQAIKRMGAAGVKFFGAPPEILFAAIDETVKQGLNSTMHHAQLAVTEANVLTTSKAGLKSMEHWYGLPEALFDDKIIQRYPNDYIYQNEQQRFAEAGRLWRQAAKPGTEKWNAVMATLLERDFGISPTFAIYVANRDFMRMSRAPWHDVYTFPALWEFFRPNRNAHGSYWFYWTLEDEIEWKNNYQIWMRFVNEYKNRGGRVTVGTDSGYIYSLYGFAYVTEMTLLREAGFSPLEVIHSATLQGARQLKIDREVGSIQVGKKADFVVVPENPLVNLYALYGTGAIRLNDETGEVERVGGVRHVIKDGIVYDARKLLADIRAMVKADKEKKGIKPGPMPLETVPFYK